MRDRMGVGLLTRRRDVLVREGYGVSRLVFGKRSYMVGEVRVRLYYAEESYSTYWYGWDKIVDICHGSEIAVLVIRGDGQLLNKLVQ
jgi:hypothetical protein